MATAKDEANAEAWNSEGLRERLRVTEADRDSLAAGLKAEQEAHAKTKQTLAGGQRAHGDHVAVLGLFAQQQTRAKEVRGLQPASSTAASCSGSLHRA